MSVTVAVNDASWFFSPYTWYVSGSSYARTNDAGAYMKASFTGTSVKLNVDVGVLNGASIVADRYPTIAYSIDGASATRYQLTSVDSQITMATGLSPGTHTLRIDYVAVLAIDDQWTTPTMALVVTGLELDTAAALTSQSLLSRRLLVYGDSVAIGPETLGVGTTAANMDATLAYGPIISEAIGTGAEYGIVGFGGHGYGVVAQGNVPKGSTAFSFYSNGLSRLVGGLFSPAPSAILFGYGINDSGGSVDSEVTSLINSCRAAAPLAAILVCIPWSGDNLSEITAGFNTAADDNSYLLNTGRTNYHESGTHHLWADGQQDYADDLIALLPDLWSATGHFSTTFESVVR